MQRYLFCPRAAFRGRAGLFFAILIFAASSAGAQGLEGAVISGSVKAEDTGIPLPGVHVFLEGTSLGAVSGNDGSFDLRRVPAGRYVLVARYVGFESHREDVSLEAGARLNRSIFLKPTTISISEVVVTATGERKSRSEIAATVQSVGRETIDKVKPTHPSEIMGRIPGVWINVTSGEGHMTAIRQPLTTDPVYLYLENGVPTRSTGFFNHNALYETNIPMAEDIEVIKGPGTALYGSDAIGGVINVSTRRPPLAPMADLSVETGSFGYGRLMIGTGTQAGAHSLRLDLNASRSDGWRDASRFERQTGTATWHVNLPGASRLKTVASFSLVDQAPAGSVALPRADYEARPSRNITPISYRDVKAVRISSAYERFGTSWNLEVTPYFRFNEMGILPNWSLTYDPTVYTTRNLSFGALSRMRRDIGSVQLVGGIDVEHSPGSRLENRIDAVRQDGVFTSYTKQEALYDYAVAFNEVSPYLHAEVTPIPRVRISGGLRLDILGYDYENHLDVVTTGAHRRAASTSRQFSHLSPKLGATYALGGGSSLFASYRHAFRVPSENQLFRQGSTTNTLDLDPVTATNLEAGLRLRPARSLEMEVSVYQLSKTNDIVGFVDENGLQITTNAGETSHKGVEGGVRWQAVSGLVLQAGGSYAIHRFETWTLSSTVDFSGNEMDVAPRVIAFGAVTYSPAFASGSSFILEWNRLGRYWMDPAHSARYEGHSVVNFRSTIDLPAGLALFGGINNLLDTRYAESASYNAFRGEEFAPGMPRSFHLGLELRLQGDRQP